MLPVLTLALIAVAPIGLALDSLEAAAPGRPVVLIFSPATAPDAALDRLATAGDGVAYLGPGGWPGSVLAIANAAADLERLAALKPWFIAAAPDWLGCGAVPPAAAPPPALRAQAQRQTD